MADTQTKKKVYKVLREGYFNDPDDAVDVSDGPEDSIHLVVFSRKFTGRSMKEKHDLIWSELMQKLKTDEWNKISLSLGQAQKKSRPRRGDRCTVAMHCGVCVLSPNAWRISVMQTFSTLSLTALSGHTASMMASAALWSPAVFLC